MKNLLIIRGAPGSGKSTIASKLVQSGLFDFYYEADSFFYKEGQYNWKANAVPLAHEWCQEQVRLAMVNGYRIIVSNTFVRNQDVTPYLELADKYGYTVQEMILWNAPFKNVHGVPEDKVQQKLKTLHSQFK